MIARINHEHAEREKLEQARQELLKRKQALIAENKKRKDDLANLDQDLEKFIDVRSLLSSRSFFEYCQSLLIDLCDSRQPNQSRKSSKRNTKEDVKRLRYILATTLGWRYFGRNRYPSDLMGYIA
jgi:phosphatidylinositol glycan class S